MTYTQTVPHPTPITSTYDESYDDLRESIDRYIRALRYFNPKVVIYKNRFDGTWKMVIYRKPDWDQWIAFYRKAYRDL